MSSALLDEIRKMNANLTNVDEKIDDLGSVNEPEGHYEDCEFDYDDDYIQPHLNVDIATKLLNMIPFFCFGNQCACTCRGRDSKWQHFRSCGCYA